MKKLLILSSLLSLTTLDAQTPPRPVTRVRLANVNSDPGNVMIVSSANVGPVIKQAPYSAEAVTETVQTLADGNRIVQRSTVKLYRDSEGRERREEGSPTNLVFISDPNSNSHFTLRSDKATSETMFLQGGLAAPAPTTGIVTMTRTVAAPFSTLQAGRALPTTMGLGQSKKEDLGKRFIEGVETNGTRTTTTIPAGEIGNDRAIEIIDEEWFSPALQLNVMTRHYDPRTGDVTYRLTQLQRVEPLRSLFEGSANVPSERGTRGLVFVPGPQKQ
jgi:hypothetical protein